MMPRACYGIAIPLRQPLFLGTATIFAYGAGARYGIAVPTATTVVGIKVLGVSIR